MDNLKECLVTFESKVTVEPRSENEVEKIFIRSFKVQREWLEMFLENKIEISLQEFLEWISGNAVYNYEGFPFIYNGAFETGAIIEDSLMQIEEA